MEGIELRSTKADHGQVLETPGPSDDLEIFLPDPVPRLPPGSKGIDIGRGIGLSTALLAEVTP
jgi:hypothetical protein